MAEGPIITFLSILFGDVTGDETQRGLSDFGLHGKSLLARLDRFRNILAPPPATIPEIRIWTRI